jgi:hypothetical protein
MKYGLAVLGIVIYFLHQDYWNWTDKSLVLGFLPIGIAYHAGYAILAAVFMWILVKYAWPHELESVAEHAAEGGERTP